MVDLCRPSSLPNNQSLGPANENNENNGGKSTFFSNVFVSFVSRDEKKKLNDRTFLLFFSILFRHFFSFPILNYSSLKDTKHWQQQQQQQRWNNRDSMKKNYAFKRKKKKIKVKKKPKSFFFVDRLFFSRCQCVDRSKKSFKNIFKTSITTWRQIRVKLRTQRTFFLRVFRFFSYEDSIESLRRFQSEPSLPNPSLESGNYKMKSNIRQRLLSRHKELTPMSDKRHPTRSTNFQKTGRFNVENSTKIFTRFFFSSKCSFDAFCQWFNTDYSTWTTLVGV